MIARHLRLHHRRRGVGARRSRIGWARTSATACRCSRPVEPDIPGPASRSACQAHRQPGSELALRLEAGGEHRRPAKMRGGAHPKGRPKFIAQLEADVRRPW